MSIDVPQATFQLPEVIVSICRRRRPLPCPQGPALQTGGCPGSQGPPGFRPHSLLRSLVQASCRFCLTGLSSSELAWQGRNTTAPVSSWPGVTLESADELWQWAGSVGVSEESSSLREKDQRLLPAHACLFLGLRAVFSVWGEIT